MNSVRAVFYRLFLFCRLLFDYLHYDFEGEIDDLYQQMVQHLYRISKQHVEDVWFVLQANNVDLFPVKPPVYAFLSGETISYIVCKNQTFTGLCTVFYLG